METYLKTIFLLLFFLVPNVVKAQIEVCANCEATTIANAINIADSGDTILIRSGYYREHELIIEKPLKLVGEGAPIVDGEKSGSVIRILSDSVHISGLIIRNVDVSHTEEFAGIHLYESDHFIIKDNILENMFFGILIERSNHGEIIGNTISGESKEDFNAGNGIHGWYSSHLTISDNYIRELRDGIYLEFVDHSLISRNRSIENLRYGLHFMFSNYDDYEDNEFIDNGAGVAVMFSKFINMRRNTFYKNWGTASFGLLLKEIYDAEIEDNIFEENTVGINIEGSTRVNYKRNNLVGNGWAVKVAGGCYTNIFSENNFSFNSFDLSYNSKINDNKFEGNYWSSYVGYDLDKDGVGDTPYRPVKLFSYIANRTPETIVLLRSLFIDILNFSEKVSPVFTPVDLIDQFPKMTRIK